MRSTPNCGIADVAADPGLNRPPVLAIDKLQVSLFTRRGVLPAVDGLSLTVASGETVAIVGESGCGKSLAALAGVRLLPPPPPRVVGGAGCLLGRGVAPLFRRPMQRPRGHG